MKVVVITNDSGPNSWAFNCPLLASRKTLESKGISLSFRSGVPNNVPDSDCVFINSNVFRPLWTTDKQKIFSLLEKMCDKKLQIYWFDTTDSTWCTQFEVLPYVKLFLKNQILTDTKRYLIPFRTGRIFTDYFDDLYKCGEEKCDYPPPANQDDIAKIKVSWNSSIENYSEHRHGIYTKIYYQLRPYLYRFVNEKIKINFTPVEKNRNIDITARISLGHDRISVVKHREKILELLKNFNVDSRKVSMHDYFEELRNSKIGVSPYGVGEICYRDYETIICGATLLKPDMSHMTTWPDIYRADETYIAHKWNLSDLMDKIQMLLDDPELRIKIAERAQEVYKEYISPAGMQQFADRIHNFLSE